ncbi:hypothetical protein DMENIID0001_090110 [Sergentomyia squamirostris]
MKSLVIVFLFVAVACAELEECVKKSGISQKELERFKKADYTSEDPKTHCFVKCVLEKKNFFDDKGLPKADIIGRHLAEKNPGKNVKEVMGDCLKLTGADGEGACETTYLRYRCASQKGITIV